MSMAMAAARDENGSETAARNHTNRAGMDGISHNNSRSKANSLRARPGRRFTFRGIGGLRRSFNGSSAKDFGSCGVGCPACLVLAIDATEGLSEKERPISLPPLPFARPWQNQVALPNNWST